LKRDDNAAADQKRERIFEQIAEIPQHRGFYRVDIADHAGRKVPGPAIRMPAERLMCQPLKERRAHIPDQSLARLAQQQQLGCQHDSDCPKQCRRIGMGTADC